MDAAASIFVFVGILILISLPIADKIVKKYNMPESLKWFGLLHVWGIVILALLAHRPGGYAEKANKVNCPNCGGLIDVNFRICPYCRYNLGNDNQQQNIAPSYNMPQNNYSNQSNYAQYNGNNNNYNPYGNNSQNNNMNYPK